MKFWTRFKRLLKKSLITGIPQIVLTRNTFRKSLKVFVFCGCLIGFFWQTFSFLEVYWTYPTVVDVQYEFPDEFELPAFSVCSYNGIKSGPFCKRFPTLCYPNTSLEEFCKNEPFFCDSNYQVPENESFPTVTPRQLPDISRLEYQEMGMKAEELVSLCMLYDAPRIQECTKEYQIVNVFDVKGLPNNCYAFNSLWGRTEGAKMIKTQTMLLFHLKSERSMEDVFYSGSPFAMQLALHNPYSIFNPFVGGFSVKPCSNYYIFPSKLVSERLPPPFATGCFDYEATWLERFGKGPLTKRLCQEECYLNVSMKHFNCVDSYYITYPNMENICHSEPDNPDVFRACRDFCPKACSREEILVDVQEHTHLTSRRGISRHDKCQSMIVVSFNRMQQVKYSYSAKYESISLFSYIGGYLGLWLGISLVAISDVIETALLIIQWLYAKCQRRRKNKIVDNAYGLYMEHPKAMWVI